MEFYTSRKLKFKAWDEDNKLLIRLNRIDCVRGELVMKNHILLQFTGLRDQQSEELYEMDIVLIGTEKHVVVWDVSQQGWYLVLLTNSSLRQPLLAGIAEKATRLWSYYESTKDR